MPEFERSHHVNTRCDRGAIMHGYFPYPEAPWRASTDFGRSRCLRRCTEADQTWFPEPVRGDKVRCLNRA
jgi:hypothetical protein